MSSFGYNPSQMGGQMQGGFQGMQPPMQGGLGGMRPQMPSLPQQANPMAQQRMAAPPAQPQPMPQMPPQIPPQIMQQVLAQALLGQGGMQRPGGPGGPPQQMPGAQPRMDGGPVRMPAPGGV